MIEKCELCWCGLNGRNGNGYLLCSCEKKVVVIGSLLRVNNFVWVMCCVLLWLLKKLWVKINWSCLKGGFFMEYEKC